MSPVKPQQTSDISSGKPFVVLNGPLSAFNCLGAFINTVCLGISISLPNNEIREHILFPWWQRKGKDHQDNQWGYGWQEPLWGWLVGRWVYMVKSFLSIKWRLERGEGTSCQTHDPHATLKANLSFRFWGDTWRKAEGGKCGEKREKLFQSVFTYSEPILFNGSVSNVFPGYFFFK